MKSYRVKYTLEKVVVIKANNPQEAEKEAASLEDFNYEFFRDCLKAEEMEDKTTSTMIYIKNTGVSQFNRKVSKDIPLEERAFDDVQSIEFLQDTEDFVELRIISYNLSSGEIMNIAENICQRRLNSY